MIDVLVLTGPPGAGKSTIATEVSDRLAAAGVGHAVVDLDELNRLQPEGGSALGFRNLASVWDGYAAEGARRLVLAALVESAADLERISDAVGGARLTVCRLRARTDTLVDRIGRRETDLMRARMQALARRWAQRLDDEDLGEPVIETDAQPVAQVADAVVTASGWLSRPA